MFVQVVQVVETALGRSGHADNPPVRAGSVQ